MDMSKTFRWFASGATVLSLLAAIAFASHNYYVTAFILACTSMALSLATPI